MNESGSLMLQMGNPAPRPEDPLPEHVLMSGWTSSKNILVSVIVHTFQHAEYIADALNGILMQKTDFPFEVIVHDDASTDGTREILLQYEARYPNVIKLVLQSENQFSRGRRSPEFTFPLAKGKYIALCEGDDYWMDENKLQIQADFMEADPSCAVCGHDAFIFRDGLVVSPSKLSDRPRCDYGPDQLKKGVFALSLSLMFVNRVKDVPPEQLQSLNGDKFLLSRLGAFGGYRHVPGIKPAAYRVHSGGVWSTLSDERKQANRVNTLFWMSRYYRRLGDSRMETYFVSQIAEQLNSGLLRISYRDLIGMLRSLLRAFVLIRFPRICNAIKSIRSRMTN